MILGCTPEFREMLARFQCPVYLIDVNPEMKLSMDLLISRKNVNEKFIESDWLSLDQKIPAGSVDIALGDFVTNNIDYANRSIFLGNIKKVLKKGGYFISRDYVALKKRKNLNEILKRYINKNKTKINFTELWWDFLFNLTYDKRSGTIDNGKIGAVTKSAKAEYRDILKEYFVHFPVFKKVWTVPEKVDQDNEYKSFFEIEKIIFNNDYYYAEICPIYFLRKI